MKALILFFTLIALLDFSQGQDSVTSETPAICFLPEKTNNRGRSCKALIPLYRYDSKSKLCVQFIYGGCGGTANQFPTLKECVEFCGAENGFIPPGNMHDFLWDQRREL